MQHAAVIRVGEIQPFLADNLILNQAVGTNDGLLMAWRILVPNCVDWYRNIKCECRGCGVFGTKRRMKIAFLTTWPTCWNESRQATYVKVGIWRVLRTKWKVPDLLWSVWGFCSAGVRKCIFLYLASSGQITVHAKRVWVWYRYC